MPHNADHQFGLAPDERASRHEWRSAETDLAASLAVPEEVEEAPDYTDTVKWIRVETTEYIDGGTLGQATRGFNVTSGRVLTTYRPRRLPEEEGLDHVVGEPYFPIPMQELQVLPPYKREDWELGVHSSLLRRFLASDDPDSEKRNYGSGAQGFHDRSGKFIQ